MPKYSAYRRHSCCVVVIRQTADAPLFLLLKAYTKWDFPKGMIDLGERPLDAAIREVREETTIRDLQFPWGYQTIDTGPYGKGKISRYFGANRVGGLFANFSGSNLSSRKSSLIAVKPAAGKSTISFASSR